MSNYSLNFGYDENYYSFSSNFAKTMGAILPVMILVIVIIAICTIPFVLTSYFETKKATIEQKIAKNPRDTALTAMRMYKKWDRDEYIEFVESLYSEIPHDSESSSNEASISENPLRKSLYDNLFQPGYQVRNLNEEWGLSNSDGE